MQKKNKKVLPKRPGIRALQQKLYPELAHLYRRVVDFTGDAVYRYSIKDGRIITANQGLVKVLDLDCHPGDLVGKKLKDLLVYTEKAGHIRKLVLKKGAIHGHVYHFKTLKGDDRWVIHDSFLSSARKDGDQYVDAIVKDITKRKLAEDAVRAIEARLATTLKSIGDAVIATDIQGRVTFLNEVASKLTGWNESAAKGKPLKKVFHIINEITGKPAKNPIDRVLREGVVVGLANHTELIARNGTRIPIDDSAAPIKDAEGKLTGVVLVFHDVTENRRTAKALQENAEQFRTVANFTYDWEFWNDPLGRAIYVSPACEKITGRKYQDFLADSGLHRRLIHPEDLARFDRHVNLCERGHKPGEGEWRVRHTDGSYRWVAHACRPVVDSHRHYYGVRGNNRDITERKKAEHDLEASETRYRRLFESAKDGILILRPKTFEILDANPFVAELLGYTRQELIGKKRWKLASPKDVARIKAIFRSVSKGRSVRRDDLPLKAKDGRLIPVEFVSNVYRVDNETVIQCNIRDIRERKEAEEALREVEYQKALVLDNTTEIIARHDRDHKIQWANEAYLKVTGLALPEIQGHKCYRMWGLDRLCRNCPVTLAIKTGKPQFSELTPENQPHWPADQGSWLVRAAPVKDAAGNVTGAIETAIDITQQRQAEEEKRFTEARLASTLESVGDAVIATDLCGRITFFNHIATQLTGWKEKEVKGKPLATVFRIMNEKTGKKAKNPVDQVLKKGMIVGLANHTILISKNGKEIPIDDSAAPIRDEKGALTGVVLVFHDVTEHRRAENALRESEERFRTIYENAPALMDAFDEKGRCVLWNKECRKVFGWTIEEINAHKDPLALFYPDPAVRKQVIKTVTKGPCGIFREWRPVTKKGKELVVMWANFRLPGGLVMNLGYDITDRNRTLQELEQYRGHLEELVQTRTRELNDARDYLGKIINSVGNPIFVKDRKHRWVLLNDAYCKFMGFSRKELIGKSDYDFFPAAEAKVFWAKDEAVFKSGKTNVNEEYFTDSKGVKHTILTKKVLYKDESGQQYIVGIITDITKLKEMEHELMEHRDHLEDLVEERTFKLRAEIRERKRTEDLLKDVNERFRAVVDNSLDIVYRRNMKTDRYDFFSPIVKNITGYSNKELVGKSLKFVLGRVHPDDLKASKTVLEKAQKGLTKHGTVEYRFRHKQGGYRWLSDRFTIVKDAEGRPLYWVGVSRDITETKHAEEALRRAADEWKATFDSVNDAVWLLGRDQRVLRANRATKKIFSKTASEILGRYCWEVAHNSSRPVAKCPVLKATRNKRRAVMEFEAGGKWLSVAVDPVFGAGKKILGFVHVVSDITERKRAEEAVSENRRQLRQIIDTVPHMIFAKDAKGRFLLVNREVGMMYNKEPHELLGQKREDIHPVPEEARAFIAADREVLATKKPMLVANEPFTDVRGRKHILQTIKIPFKMAGIKEEVILGVSVDVTEQRKVEEFRNDIVRTVSHELRTPLSIEKEGISLLMDGMLGPVSGEQKEVLATVMRSIDRLGRMITSLLDISSIETGRIKMVQKMTDLAALVKDVVLEFNKRASEKKIALNIKLSENVVPVLADSDRITQVLSNLVDNALKFTPQGGAVEISVNIFKNAVECEIRDTGIGIAPANTEKLFEKFQQFSRIAGPGEKGFGLGLSIAKGIIEMHGGRIWAKSELGKGTRVTFLLPLWNPSALKSAAKNAESRRSAGRPLYQKREA